MGMILESVHEDNLDAWLLIKRNYFRQVALMRQRQAYLLSQRRRLRLCLLAFYGSSVILSYLGIDFELCKVES